MQPLKQVPGPGEQNVGISWLGLWHTEYTYLK